jgi:L-ribulose-5-phosphate 4-epimerase
MLKKLKNRVCQSNLELWRQGLVTQTWGNVSGIDRDSGLVVIKPSGVSYEKMKPDQMVVISLKTGQVVDGSLKPSSDAPTHLELYRTFEHIGGVVHTHSLYATAWAQACKEIPPLGTTHADYFHGAIPCTRPLTDAEIQGDYETNTGKVILERFKTLKVMDLPGVLVAQHGPFAWGPTPEVAVEAAVVMEHLARLAATTLAIAPDCKAVQDVLLDKHFLRKHGPDAYYGQ